MEVMRRFRGSRLRWVGGGVLAVVLALGAARAGHAAFERMERSPARQAELAQQATITLDQAREAALAVVPGTIRRLHLEREWGGGLVYEIKIRPSTGRGESEVEVDAMSGAVLDIDDDDD
jgi:uncharacterized membrane protein YkoI